MPAGKYRTGSLFLKNHVTLQIEQGATLVGSTDDTDYPIIDTRVNASGPLPMRVAPLTG